MSQSSNSSSEVLTQLRQNLVAHFNLEELRTLCFDLDIEHENLPDSKEGLARELVRHCKRVGRLLKLTKTCSEERPDLSWAGILERLQVDDWNVPPAQTEPLSPVQPSEKNELLCNRITEAGFWRFLEKVTIQAATAGGMAAMGFYREVVPTMDEEDTVGYSSASADLQATVKIFETLNSLLPPITEPDQLSCMLNYLGEDDAYKNWIRDNIGSDIHRKILSAKDFFSSQKNVLRVVVNGISGTASFIRGLPLFCSAVALLVDDQPRVSAVYDPIHHIVHSAVLPGPYDRPCEEAEASTWHIATGSRTDLVVQSNKDKERFPREKGTTIEDKKPHLLKKEAIAIHLTRSNPRKLHKYFETDETARQNQECMLERLAVAAGEIYALNSGVLAMTNVATGALGAFVNNITNLWDVAPGEVLVRACGGQVTEFDGSPVVYSTYKKVSVIAAKEYLHDTIVSILNK